jgi:hypothetical protein
MNNAVIPYKLGTSLSLVLTADASSGFVFTEATKRLQIYKDANSRTNPIFDKPWSADVSPTETLCLITPTEITLKPDTYWASFIIEHSPTQKVVLDFKIKIGLFDNDIVPGDCKLVLKLQKNSVVIRVQGAVVNNTGSSAPPRVYNENLTPQINGSINTFTTAFPLVSGSEEVKLNGITQTLLDDYIATNSTTIQLVIIPITGDHISISYNKL